MKLWSCALAIAVALGLAGCDAMMYRPITPGNTSNRVCLNSRQTLRTASATLVEFTPRHLLSGMQWSVLWVGL